MTWHRILGGCLGACFPSFLINGTIRTILIQRGTPTLPEAFLNIHHEFDLGVAFRGFVQKRFGETLFQGMNICAPDRCLSVLAMQETTCEQQGISVGRFPDTYRNDLSSGVGEAREHKSGTSYDPVHLGHALLAKYTMWVDFLMSGIATPVTLPVLPVKAHLYATLDSG
ncbi:hypothetical protein BDN67DRAFT_984091 [Paxillus ammoniavirescens]|nr:hypothetical protein BDN67DRAFT_984091 [Paxillus ammoniavirescens]